MAQGFRASENVISRRNQDGTIILMKLDESSLFYKIQGVAASVWAELEKPQTEEGLIEHFSELYPADREQLRTDIPAFIRKLANQGLVSQAEPPGTASFRTTGAPVPNYLFGELKEYNLEMIETEVLNESVYLDVFAGSDLRLKKDVTSIENALSKVTQLEGITYSWNPETSGLSDGATRAGLVAQQVALHMPELVRKDEKTGFLAVEYSKLTSYLVEAIKDLNHLVLDQEKRIQDLEKRLSGESQLDG